VLVLVNPGARFVLISCAFSGTPVAELNSYFFTFVYFLKGEMLPNFLA